MHLLVLSAFRRAVGAEVSNLKVPSQCTFWCSVLSDGLAPGQERGGPMSQCTFWCSVLSDKEARDLLHFEGFLVSMHLLVLSAFRQWYVRWNTEEKIGLNAPFGAQCFPTRGGCVVL